VVARGGDAFALGPAKGLPDPNFLAKPSAEHDKLRVGTAWQGTSARPEPTEAHHNVGMETVTPENMAKQMANVTHLDVDARLPKSITSIKDGKKKAEAYLDWAVKNLIALHNAFPKELRRRATHWYDGARRIAEGMGKQFGLTVEQAGGILAVFSPKKDWFQNVQLARNLADIMRNHMDVVIGSDPSHKAAMKDMIEAATTDQAERRKMMKAITGKTVRQLWDATDEEAQARAAWGVRALSEAIHGREYQTINPEGDDLGVFRTQKGTGPPQDIVWQSVDAKVKAMRIFLDGSAENISGNLGLQHKVRSFYNNITAPNSLTWDVTMDTHAVAAATLFPLGSVSTLVTQNFGGAGTGVGGGGNRGIYWLNREAYLRAAKELGIQPRQLQSITWEAARGLFPQEVKQHVRSQMLDIWATSTDHVATRAQILGRGIEIPFWADRPGAGADRRAGAVPGAGAGESAGAAADRAGGVQQRVRQGGAGRAPGAGGVAGKGGAAFSIASADYLERLAPQLQAKGLPPKERQRMFQRAQEQVAGMARAMRENDSTIGALRVAEIERERIDRRKAREDELVGEIENRLGGILSQPELAQAQNGPLISRFLVKKPGEKFFRGTLLSKSAARKAGRDFRGEYDGAQGLPSWLFGAGTEGPDTAAQEAFKAGLIPEATPDALWDGIRAELAKPGGWQRR
jgi:hypothetical protein